MAWLKRVTFALAAVLLIGIVAGQRLGDASLLPLPGEATVTLQIVDYGYHAALFLPRDVVLAMAKQQGRSKLVAVAERFAAYQTLEVGWGDAGFYRTVPSIDDLKLGPAISAALGLNTETVLLVVGHMEPVDARYPGSARALVTLSTRAFARMILALDDSLAGTASPTDLGVGLYGPSLFYRATGHYSLANVCNHWLARLINAAGLPINLTLATLSRPLVWQLAGSDSVHPLP